MSNRRIHVGVPHLAAALWPALTRLGLEAQGHPEGSILSIVPAPALAAPRSLALDAVPSDAALQREIWRVCPELKTFRLGPTRVDLPSRRLRSDAGTSRLSPTELRLLLWMRGRRGHVVSREELLVEVWGYVPGVHTRTVTATMHRLRAKLEHDPSNPQFLRTEHGLGYRLTSGEVPGGEAALFGRARELEALVASPKPGIVTVTGVGGVGKSRLLATAYSGAAQRYQRTAYVELQPTDDVRAIRARVGSALGLRTGIDAPDALRRAIGSDPTLVVVDQGDQAAEALRAFLEDWPEGAILWVGSRRPIGHPEERIIPLQGLDEAPATELLLRLARARRPDWNAASVAPLVRLLDGLPFALELAAAQARVLDAEAIVERLQQRRDLRGAGGRHRSLHAVLTDTLEGLSSTDMGVLRCVCTFACPAPLEAIEHLVGPDAVAALAALAAQALVRPTDDGRIAVLDTVRQVVGTHEPFRLGIAAWLLAHDGPLEEWLAVADGATGMPRAALVAGLGRKLVDAGAFAWLAEWLVDLDDPPDAETRDGLALLRAHCAVEEGRPSEAVEQLQGLFAGPCATEARLRTAEWALDLGDPDTAVAALAPVQRIGLPGLRRRIAEGGVCFLRGQHAEAEGHYTEAVEQARRLGDQRWLSVALFSLSVCPFVRGSFHEMVALLQEAHAVAVDHPLERALAGHCLGIALHRLERIDDAVAAMRAAEQTCRSAGLHRTTASILSDLGGVLGEQGMAAEATIRQALVLARTYELMHFEQTSLINLATVQLNRVAFAEATETLDLLEASVATHPRPLLAAAHASLRGVLCHGMGELERALEWLRDAAAQMEAQGHRNRAPMIWGRMAWIHAAQGDSAAATHAKAEARARVGEGERSMAWLVEAFALRADEAAGRDIGARSEALRADAAGRHRVQVVLNWRGGGSPES